MAWLIAGGKVIASLEIASSWRERRQGLLGRDGIEGALLLERTRSVHSLGMRFAMDVAHCDADLKVLRVKTMPANRIGMLVPRARIVIEAEAGSLRRWGVRPGVELEIPPLSGTLILIGTPIGNLGDLSPRAAEALGSADLVCCEDTRRTGRLLKQTGIHAKKLRRVDEHTEANAAADICRLLASGKEVALVSDAGMPSVSDPGRRLVAAVAEAGYDVTVIGGPSAVVVSLAVSGFEGSRFCFEGFLPRKGRKRAQRLEEIALERRTVVLFESPHRLQACLRDLADACGASRRAVIARGLTKLHEELVRGTLAELSAWAQRKVRGEVVVVIEGDGARR